MLSHRHDISGFTLLEVLLVVAMVAILAVLVMPGTQVNSREHLEAAAGMIATDLAYGRSLAVSNNSQYRFTWDPTNNRYILEHSGANAALNTLPVTPFSLPGDPATQHIVALADLPHVGPPVQLVVAATGSGSQRVDTLEFTPLGGTTASSPTILWLSSGSDGNKRYITIEVNPVTGLATVGAFTTEGPPSALLATSRTG